MRRLICTFVVRIWHKQVFSWRGSLQVQNSTGGQPRRQICPRRCHQAILNKANKQTKTTVTIRINQQTLYNIHVSLFSCQYNSLAHSYIEWFPSKKALFGTYLSSLQLVFKCCKSITVLHQNVDYIFWSFGINEPILGYSKWAASWQKKIQISLGVCLVWSESSFCAQWVAEDPMFFHANSEDSDQTGRMPGWSESWRGAKVILLVLSWDGSNIQYQWKICYASAVLLLMNRLNETESGIFISWVISLLAKNLFISLSSCQSLIPWGNQSTTHDISTIPLHHYLPSTALREFSNLLPIHVLMSSRLFFCRPVSSSVFLPFCSTHCLFTELSLPFLWILRCSHTIYVSASSPWWGDQHALQSHSGYCCKPPHFRHMIFVGNVRTLRYHLIWRAWIRFFQVLL